MYAISASHLLKSLKLEVQHCIDLSDPSLCKYLKFALAPVHTSSLPYQFSIVEGGEFPANSRYGSIERSKFCLLGIVGEEETGGQGNGEQEQNNEGQGQSNGEEGGGDSGDGDSGDEGGKGGRKKKEGQGQQGEEGGGAGQQKGGGRESGGVEGNQQQEGADERMEQDGEDEVKSKAEGKEVQHESKCYIFEFFYLNLFFIIVAPMAEGGVMSNGEGGAGDSRDGKSGDEGGKGGEKQKGGQSQEGEGGAEKGGEGGDENQQYSQEKQGKEELGDEKEKQKRKGDKIQKEKNKEEELAQSSSCCKYNHDYIKLYINVYSCTCSFHWYT